MIEVKNITLSKVYDTFLSEDNGERLDYFELERTKTVKFLGIPLFKRVTIADWEGDLRIDPKEVENSTAGRQLVGFKPNKNADTDD